jgi:L-ornithine Nalpha-acyltransferase
MKMIAVTEGSQLIRSFRYGVDMPGNGQSSTRRLMQLLRPETSGVAQTAIAWLKPASQASQARATGRGFSDAPVYGRLGALELHLAQKKQDVKRAQKLRYRVFYENGTAIADAATMLARRDKDAFDRICDHLLVMDHAAQPSLSGKQPVVGTYRLLRQEVAAANQGFYSEGEFDIADMIGRHPDLRFLELGRSCVLPGYRNKRTLELLWQGIWSYIRHHRIDAMIGCASFGGTDPERLALPLSFLHHYAAAPDAWRARANASRYVEMNRMTRQAIDAKLALRQLPPLVKGYLRLGAYIGDGAVIDYQFGTIDVLVIMPVASIKTRYIDHFGAGASLQVA